MSSIFSILAKPKNRQVISWLGGGIVMLAVGGWTVVTYVWPHYEPAKSVCAQEGIAVGGNVSGSTITNSVSNSSSAGPCVETKKAP